jgi:uncharacterized membrane protein
VTDSTKTTSGLDPNVAAALSYALGWVTGLLFLLTEPENKFVRFHALQSTILFAFLSVLCVLLQMFWLVGMLITVFLVVPASAVVWLILMFNAYQGVRFKLPVVGDMAEQRV